MSNTMTKKTKPKQDRVRTGALLVEMEDDLRTMLDMVIAAHQEETNMSISKSEEVRALIRADFRRRGLKLPG
jgi:hypothetical protein